MVKSNPVTYFDEDGRLHEKNLVLLTQTEEKLKTVVPKTAKLFFSNPDLKEKMLIENPVPFKDIQKSLSELKEENLPEKINLFLIGHGGGGYVGVGPRYYTHDLNKLMIPSSVSNRVEKIFLLHCFAGYGIEGISRNTLVKRGENWRNLKTISGNIYSNQWTTIGRGAYITRQGWRAGLGGTEEEKIKIAKELTENAPDRSFTDMGLKSEIAFTAQNISDPEGYHRTYSVESGKASLSYRLTQRTSVAKQSTKAASRS